MIICNYIATSSIKTMTDFNAARRAQEIIELFKNALIYTVVLRNIDGLVKDKDHSIVIIIISTAIAAAGIYMLECYVQLQNEKHQKAYFKPLLNLSDFILNVSGNILVQLTSSLAATLAIAVFASAKTILWGFAGAFSSLTLLWLLQATVRAAAVSKEDIRQNQ